MTRDEALTIAERRNATETSGCWFARGAEDKWEVVRIEHPLGRPQSATGTARQPADGPGPDPHPTLPGGVRPWSAGS